MVDTKYYCDKCGSLIQADRMSYQPRTGAKRHDPSIDLCGRCEAEFRTWLGPPPGKRAKSDAA